MNKSGMYGEMPIIKIGKFEISEMSDKEDCDSVWIHDTEQDDGGEFKKDALSIILGDFYSRFL